MQWDSGDVVYWKFDRTAVFLFNFSDFGDVKITQRYI